MERVGILIDKLREQYAQHAEIDTLLATSQMILIELQQQKKGKNLHIFMNIINITKKNTSIY